MVGLWLGLGPGVPRRPRAGQVFDLDPTYRGRVLDADPLTGRFQSWTNDPPSADRVGRYRTGSRFMSLTDKLFAQLFTFSRPSKRTNYDATGALIELGNDLIAQGYDPASLLPAGWWLEGASTNLVRNPRGEGAVPGVVGSGGALPAFWALNNANAGTLTVVGSGVEAGVPYVDLRYDTTGAGNITINFEAASGSPLTASAIHTESLWAKIVAGAVANFTSLQMRLRTDATAAANGPAVTDILPGLTGTLKRLAHQQTVAADATAGRPQLLCNYSGAGSLTIRIGGPQLEANYYASSLILPPVGAPAAATRAADNLTIGGSVFAALFGSGAPEGCIILDVLPGQAAPSTGGQTIAQLDDGTDNNRIVLTNAAGGLTVVGDVVSGGVAAGPTASAGSLVVGTVARVGLRWSGGGISVCKDGGPLQSLAAARPAGLNTLRLGNRADLMRPGNSRLRPVRGTAYAPSDAKFQAACVPGADIASILG